jgi:hypothetical protein
LCGRESLSLLLKETEIIKFRLVLAGYDTFRFVGYGHQTFNETFFHLQLDPEDAGSRFL